MSEIHNDRLLRALARQPVDRTPVWLMRQAGRYLPEYRATRQRAGSFMTLCATPELACEVTLQPLRRYNLDAAIVFSDILTIPDAMGLGLHFTEGEGPSFERPLRSVASIARLAAPDPERELGYVMDAVRLVRRELAGSVPLIGFSGSPWTLATYMVEGRGSKEFRHIKGLMFDDPGTLARLLDVLADSVASYLNAQIAAGAQAVMIFDTWGGVLDEARFAEFSLASMARIVANLNREADGRPVPVVLFSKGAGAHLPALAATGCDGLGIDWTMNLGRARDMVGDRVALQGNLDPGAVYARPQQIRAAVAEVLESFGPGAGHVFNLGHGLQPHMDPDHVGAMIDAVHELSPRFHANSAQS